MECRETSCCSGLNLQLVKHVLSDLWYANGGCSLMDTVPSILASPAKLAGPSQHVGPAEYLTLSGSWPSSAGSRNLVHWGQVSLACQQ
jgi:hypothetical protein